MHRKKIAVLMASVDREYQQDFAAGLAATAPKYGMDICIFNSQGHMNLDITSNAAEEGVIYDLPVLEDYDGIISMPATMGSELAVKKISEKLLPLRGKPHVSIDVPWEGAATIQFNDRISIEELTEHLITEHGARKFAIVSGPRNSSVAIERIEACRRVLGRHGLELEERLIFDGQWTRIGGRQAAEKILSMAGELPDAVVCGNDDMALSVIEYLNEHGVRVPDDTAVTGFDALREAVMRGLTTICRPIDRSARKALEILNRWIETGTPEETKVLLPTIPIFGNTCGCLQKPENIQDKLLALGTERWQIETSLTQVSMFSGTLAGVQNEQDAHNRIHEFVRSWDIREFYLCIDPAICRENEPDLSGRGYPEEMLLLYGFRNGREYDISYFPTRIQLPLLEEVRKNNTCLVFCPLYYLDRNFGYVAMDLGNGTGSVLYPVLMLLNGALMSLYLQTNLRRSAKTIEQIATHDIMTGMLNRRGYMELASESLEKARANGKVFALLSADMNRMKFINDQFGHSMGDEAICRMGRALQESSRYGLTPVHISGDEFLAFGTVDEAQQAGEIVQLLKAEIDRINRSDPWICDISASFGYYAAVPEKEDDLDRYMTLADRSMYAEKNKGKYGRRKDDLPETQKEG